MLEDIKQIIDQILVNNSQTKMNSIDINMNLQEDIGLDSLDLAELTVHIESKYGVDIFESGIIYTVGEILEKIDN